jgi:hypothetical protein
MLDSTAIQAVIGSGAALLGFFTTAAATDPQTFGLGVVAVIGGLLSVAMTAYGTYRKINKDYGVDEIKAANSKLDDMQQRAAELREENGEQNKIIARQSAELLELIKTQNALLMQINRKTQNVVENTQTVVDNTTVAALPTPPV